MAVKPQDGRLYLRQLALDCEVVPSGGGGRTACDAKGQPWEMHCSGAVGFKKSRKTATATADHQTFTLQYSTTKQEFIKPRIYSDTRRALVFYQRVGPPPRLRQLATRLGIRSMKP